MCTGIYLCRICDSLPSPSAPKNVVTISAARLYLVFGIEFASEFHPYMRHWCEKTRRVDAGTSLLLFTTQHLGAPCVAVTQQWTSGLFLA